MPTPPYARMRISVNGGAPLSTSREVAAGDVVQLDAESTAAWQKWKWEIFGFPPDFTTPAGWAFDADAGIFYSYDLRPAAITVPADPQWGKWLPRLKVDQVVDGAVDKNLTDSSIGWEKVSPIGLHDWSSLEETQFGGLQSWILQQQQNLRIISDGIAGGTGVGSASGDVTGAYLGPLSVVKVRGAAVPAAGALVAGNVLQVSGVSSLAYGPVNLAGGANYVTGLLPGANVAPNFAATVVASLQVSGLTTGLLHADGSGNVTSSLLVNADISASAAIAVSKLAPGAQFQALVAGVAGAPQWGTVNLGQAAALSGVGADARVPFAASGALAFAAGLAFNSGTNVLTASGGLVTGSLRATGLVGPGFVVAAPDGTLSIGAGAGSSFGLIYVATVALLEALSITGLPDRARAVVQEFPPGVDEFFLNISGNDAAGTAMGVDHTNYLVLATAGAGAPKWLRRSN